MAAVVLWFCSSHVLGDRHLLYNSLLFFFFNDTATTEIYTLSLHDALPISYAIRGALAEELRRTPGLTLKPNVGQAVQWVYFADQWDPKSPWRDRRGGLGAHATIDPATVDPGGTHGYSKYSCSVGLCNVQLYEQPPRY